MSNALLRIYRSLARILLYCGAGLLLVGVALRLTVWIDPPLEGVVTALLGESVSVAETSLEWRELRPALRLGGVEIAGAEGGATIEQLRLTSAPLASLLSGSLRWKAAVAVGVRLAVRETDDGWQIAGLPVAGAEGVHLLPRSLRLVDVELHLERRQAGQVLRLAGVDAALQILDGQRFTLGAVATELPEAPNGLLRVVATGSLDNAPGKLDLAAELRSLNATPLLAFLGAQSGQGVLDGQLWLTVRDRRPEALFGELVLTDFAVEKRGDLPGVDGLTARVGLHGRTLKGRLTMAQASLDLPLGLDDPVAIERATAELEAGLAADGDWYVALERLAVLHRHGRAAGRMRLDSRGGAPSLFVRAAAVDVDVTAVPAYVPARITPPQTRKWLRSALLGGQIKRADLLFHGPLGAFPFDANEGVFAARADVRGGRLRFNPQWPEITEIDAELRFDGAKLRVDGRSGRLGGAALSDVTVAIDELRKPVLDVHGTAAGDAAGALDFLAASPLGRSWLGDPVALTAAGPLHLELTLRAPLARFRPENIELDGRVELAGASAAIAPWFRLEALSGAVDFDANGVHNGQFHGVWGGEPVHLQAETGAVAGRPRIRLDASGFGTPASLVDLIKIDPPWLDGPSPWQVRAWLPAFKPLPIDPEVRLTVRSDLSSTALDLPQPLTLARGARGDLRIDIGFTRRGLESYWLDYGGGRLRAAAAAGADGWPRSAALVFGGGAPQLPRSGLRVDGRMEQLDLDAWQAWLRKHHAPQSGDAVSGDASRALPEGALRVLAGPFVAALQVDALRLGGRLYREQQVAVEVAETRAGAMKFDGELASGTAQWEAGWQRVEAQLDHLDLPLPQVLFAGERPSAGPERQPLRTLAVDRWPSAQIKIERLRLDGRHAGVARLRTRRGDEVLYLDQASLRGGVVTVAASGAWRAGETRLDARLLANDVAELLGLFGAPPAVVVATVDARANLRWPGSPVELDLSRLLGTVRLAMREGRITNVEPGAGRLVGLLGLRMLPRRILLDFGDLFGEGFAFDRVDGRLMFDGGQGVIEEFVISGAAARVVIEGSVDLERQHYDNTVSVEPRVGATLPVIGFLLGGGVGGAAGLFADQILGGGVDRALSFDYRVKGPWDAPEVDRIGAGSRNGEER